MNIVPDIDRYIASKSDLPSLVSLIAVNNFFHAHISKMPIINQWLDIKTLGPTKDPLAKFEQVCIRGYLEYAKYLRTNLNIGNSFDLFGKICKYGQLHVAQWLITQTTIDIHWNKEYAFRFSCENGHIEVAQWLIQLGESGGREKININAETDYAFRLSCKNNYLNIAQWLILLGESGNYAKIDIDADISSSAFMLSFAERQVDVVKWLVRLAKSNNTHINIRCNVSSMFTNYCKTGNIIMADLLYQLGDIDSIYKLDINAEINNYLSGCCMNGHVDMAKWLINLYKSNGYTETNINYNQIIKECHWCNNIESVKWLIKLCEMNNHEQINIFDNIQGITFYMSHRTIEITKLMIKTSVKYYGCDKINELFAYLCKKDFLKLAEWLIEWWEKSGYKMCPNSLNGPNSPNSPNNPTKFNIHADNEVAFRLSCKAGNIDATEWLLRLGTYRGYGKINIHALDEDAFIGACANGYLDTAKFLLRIGESDSYSKINIYANNNSAIKQSLQNKCTRVYEWLIHTSFSSRYKLTNTG